MVRKWVSCEAGTGCFSPDATTPNELEGRVWDTVEDGTYQPLEEPGVGSEFSNTFRMAATPIDPAYNAVLLYHLND